MDPIHPIRPVASHPAPVDPVRRVTRAGDDPPAEQRPPRERRKAPAPAPRQQPPAAGDGHVDVRA